jgi:GxxExxY protein
LREISQEDGSPEGIFFIFAGASRSFATLSPDGRAASYGAFRRWEHGDHRGIDRGSPASRAWPPRVGYEECVCIELRERGLAFERQLPLPLEYRGVSVPNAYRIDLMVGGILIELKAVESLLPIHEAQLITYLRLTKLPVGLLVNFNTVTLKDGLRRLTAVHPNARRGEDQK